MLPWWNTHTHMPSFSLSRSDSSSRTYLNIHGGNCKYIPSDFLTIFEDVMRHAHRLTHHPQELAPAVVSQAICLTKKFSGLCDLTVINHPQDALLPNLIIGMN